MYHAQVVHNCPQTVENCRNPFFTYTLLSWESLDNSPHYRFSTSDLEVV